MTTNFGCCEGRTMASQPSVYNAERHLLRLRAWEQRIQEASQTQELKPENVPLFGEPYKTNKGDELSDRIQRMLGRYEEVDTPSPFSIEAIPIPAYATLSQSDQGHLNTDKSTKPPFRNQVLSMSTQSQKEPSSNSSQPMRTSTFTTSPNHHGHSSTFSKPPLNHSQGSQLNHSVHQHKKSEAFSDLRDRVSLHQEMSAQSPDVKPIPFLHSSDHYNTDTKDTVDRHLDSTDHTLESSNTVDVSTLRIKQSPKDASLPQSNKTNTLPTQTFPSLLSSKQPSIVMTQKPTAYVRPMDGQDQLVSESPELKPSPEPYAPLPELINKSDLGKMKIMPQFLETKTDEAQCVEDILREMAHSWPPLLTAIHTPSTDEPSKSPFLANEAKHASSCPEQKKDDPSPPESSHLSQQISSSSVHCTRLEPMSSSESESSSGSESESESSIEEPPQPPVGSLVKTEPDASAVSHEDWQLGNWIRSSQQNSGTESQDAVLVSENNSLKQQPTQNVKHSSVQVVDPTAEPKPHQTQFTDSAAISQQCSKSPQENCQQSSQKSLSADVSSCSSSKKLSKPVKGGCPNHTDSTLSVKCEQVVTTETEDPCFTDRPKVKTKKRCCKKSKDSSDVKRTKLSSQHVQNSCPTQSPPQSDQLSPAPPVSISCSKPNTETTSQSGSKMPHKTTHKYLEKPGRTAKASQDLHRTPRSLMVKIDLTLLSRVPETSGTHQGVPSLAKRSTQIIGQNEVGGDVSTAHNHTKTSRKSKPQNAEVDSRTLPRKKQKLENKNASSTNVSVKLKSLSNPAEDQELKKEKKDCQHPTKSKVTAKKSKLQKCHEKTQESSKKTVKSKDSLKHKKSNGKQTEHPQSEKHNPPKSSLAVTASQPTGEALTNRSLLRFEEGQYPVKHYIKEAKRLKHKADAESDKLSKAFNYLDAAMFFVESGIAMEKDPQISLSSYTMFAETVELLKFVLKLKNSVDLSAAPSEKDFVALCLKCQALLQMTMFRHKHKTALKYSKTLTDHFTNSAQATHNPQTSKTTDNPSPNLPSPANTSTSSGPGSNHSGSGLVVGPISSTVAIPQAVEQMAFNYINITSLFLSAHDMWDQAEELAHKGSGMLAELDATMGQLNLSSSMSSMVHYTRQGVYWLRLDSHKV